MSQGWCLRPAYFAGVDSRLAGLFIAVGIAGLGYLATVDSTDSPFGGALVGFFVVAMLVGLGLLALALTIVASLWNVRRPGLRRPIRSVMLAAYGSIAVWVYVTAAASYARDLANYVPPDECPKVYGTCEPYDGRIAWLVLWGTFGLLNLANIHLRARKQRTFGWCSDCGEELVGHPAAS